MVATFTEYSLTTLVVDASVAMAACLAEDGWAPFGEAELVAPPLCVSETSSALHEAHWRGELAADLAQRAMERLSGAPINVHPLESPSQAWAVADQLGWAKTYDAEYVALALALKCRLLTLDQRLRRGVRGLVEVIGPTEL